MKIAVTYENGQEVSREIISQTTITPDYPAMASATVDIIEARLDGQTAPPSVVLPYSLLSRESVAIR